MDLGKMKKELQAHGIKVGFMTRGLYSMLAQHVPEDAPIVAAAEGVAGTNKAPVLVTPTHIYLAHYPGTVSMPQVASIDRSQVTAVEIDGGLVSSLTIRTAGGAYTVEKVPQVQAAAIASGLPTA